MKRDLNKINTSVFSVEEKEVFLYTIKETEDGHYEYRKSSRKNKDRDYVVTGESIKKGSVVISTPVYEYKNMNKDNAEPKLVGCEDYTQKLTRILKVYQVEMKGSGKNLKETFLFEKEFTIPKKI